MSALSRAEIDAARADLATMLPDTCRIRRVTRQSDGAGGHTAHRRDIAADVPCRLSPASSAAGGRAGASQAGGRLNDATTHIVTFETGTDVAIDDHIVVGEATFEVLAVGKGGAWELTRRVEVKGAA